MFAISPEDYEFAQFAARHWSYFGFRDYLHGALKRAILEDMDTLRSQKADEKQLVEDDGGGMRLAGDIDDGIPS